jgi:hypothetical protein
MLLVLEKKPHRCFHGYAGEFCVVCRAATTWKVRRVSLTTHVYQIPIGRGKHLFDELECTSCRTRIMAPVGAIHPCGTAAVDPLELACMTCSDGGDRVKARLELEQRLCSESVSGAERSALIAEPFLQLEYVQQLKSRRGVQHSINAVLGLFFFLSLIPTGVTWVIFFKERPLPNPGRLIPGLIGSTAVFFGTLGPLVWRLTSHDRLVADRYASAKLIRSLAPLRPSEDELRTALEPLRARNLLLAESIDPRQLSDAAALHRAAA